MKTTKLFASTFIGLSLLASCSDDDDAPSQPNEEEVITNISLDFVNTADANDTVTLEIIDSDGEDGPTAPIQAITGTFTAGQTYTATVDLFNSIEEEDITEEVTVDEPDEHFLADGANLGFRTTWVANTAGTGNITLRLFHESETVNDSDEFGSQTGGSTDVDVTFTGVVIE